MSAGTTVAVLVAVVVVAAALVIGLMAARRRRRLQQRFGPEYDRLVGESDSKRKAEAELTERERRVQDLQIRPLTDSARAGYARQWANLQEQFVDTPVDAVAASQLLVAAVMNERGYPVHDRDQVLADLSVEHATTLHHYRAAEEISESATVGKASTEDLRQAMVNYRALFRELLGEPADTASAATAPADSADSAPADSAPADSADSAPADSAPAADGAWAPVTPVTPAADEPARNEQADTPVHRAPRS